MGHSDHAMPWHRGIPQVEVAKDWRDRPYYLYFHHPAAVIAKLFWNPLLHDRMMTRANIEMSMDNGRIFSHPFTADMAIRAQQNLPQECFAEDGTLLPNHCLIQKHHGKDKTQDTTKGDTVDLMYGKLGNTAIEDWDKEVASMIGAYFPKYRSNKGRPGTKTARKKAATREKSQLNHLAMSAYLCILQYCGQHGIHTRCRWGGSIMLDDVGNVE